MNKGMSTGSVSLDLDRERILKYKRLAVALSYPDGDFMVFFPELSPWRDELVAEYDRLFRVDEIWLYGTEHLAENEFQRASMLADIMGFYRAFGLEPSKDRPDSLACELEFMHYLIFKRLYALESNHIAHAPEKALVCLDAQKKFFTEHLYSAAKKIAGSIISQTENAFYREIAQEMLTFLESEARFLERDV
ncbi:hypothetical protein HKBW3S03_00349 [Candidatus Hakubella thermalkaliphila]|uniref:Nitrate reductase delta subunit n=2 Tax=Candidatus Hakubella thermalkaliphila TaxID=2754717 RepID=A0A6V8QLL1_9ACTN|nr:molecular chaperone TorD family protein [Candidatus Hakubella thermalkaliphila]GFP18844.1 hypothetical protein HKBW3S03_00349 [Candidatus Hakubella thermalkaliphila]GFP29376.1 hypothetical protein HKBW3S34_00296 [Candidatus Hakubella thermalkaliphila]GFP43651.1 hypothetical protein HKBW3C_02780 [Candidatus Hakubella thermalkaliphila]